MEARVTEKVADGLSLVRKIEPGRGFIDGTFGWADKLGAFARAEAGWRPLQDLSVFGYGQASTFAGVEAGAGFRLTF
jgi:hypothetical protein